MSSVVQAAVQNPINPIGGALGGTTEKLTGSKFLGNAVRVGASPTNEIAKAGFEKLSSPGELPPPADPGAAPDTSDPAIAAAQARERRARGRSANTFAGRNYGNSPLPSVSRTLLGGA